MKKYIMALDQGTTSSRCILYNKNGDIVSTAQKEFKQFFPHNGWVEHNAMEIYSTQMGVAEEALSMINANSEYISAIGIANQRETTVVWDINTGEPVYNAIVWQCRRTADYCDQLKNKGYSQMMREKTGLVLDPYFSATKLKWILDNVEGAMEKAKKGKLLFGTIETWLIWKMTAGRVHVTDYSNASRTMMFNIHNLNWDDEILKLLNIPKNILPKPVPSSKIYGMTEPRIFGGSVPIGGAAGDQQAALFGQTCFEKTENKMTFGTGGFMLMNIGEKPVLSKNGLLTTIAWGLDGKVNYALEGSLFVAGAAIQWLRDELELVKKAPDVEKMAFSVKDSNGVIFVPAFTGLGAPYWDPYARGSFFGLTRGSNKNHLARAVLESLVFETMDLTTAMEVDTGLNPEYIKVDGGACKNNFLLQFLADMLNMKIMRPSSIETTSMGAAYLAGLASDFWKSKEDLKNNNKNDEVFIPNMDEKIRNKKTNEWHAAVKCTMEFAKYRKEV